ncbi:helix-turn-helix transcriptional regulator [Paenibacillus sinopodophylli]|uniref:helix-turn-helix transcriptional regulator n=1 Tax=Paenibacillus sinopodophylli TaxID=1837342 RepID=UPI00110C9C20|nr:YafY family protein [Paenibacillus sinopodophylli]
MKKNGRQLAIVLELQSKKQLTAQELSVLFETSVRTIYRDIDMLCEAGVPIVGLPGTGYSLMEGYFLPPISFTTEEALALLFGSEFIEQRFDNHFSRGARSLRTKIEAVLPLAIRKEADKTRESMHLLQKKTSETDTVEKSNLEQLRSAILNSKKIQFKHHKRYKNESETRETARTAAPLGLVHVEGAWILIAHCDLRNNIRHFKISRMSEITLLDKQYEVPTDFNLRDYQPKDDRHIVIQARFNKDVMVKVKESELYYMESAFLQDEGYYVTFRVHEAEELLQWILSWGSEVVIMEPGSFRERVKKEIENMLKRY